MIRNLLATTALAALVATGAYAQQAPTETPAATEPAAPVVKADGYLASNIMGETVYNGTGDNAENIGDVNDIVLDKDGKTQAIVVGVGGFLGIGERNVAVEFTKLSWAEANGDRWLVFPATREQLEALPEFDRRPYDPAPPASAANDTGTGTTAPAQTDTTAMAPATTEPAPATTDQPADTGTQMAENPVQSQPPAATTPDAMAPDTTTTGAIDKSSLTPVPAGDLKAEELIGTTVYGANDENIGEISDIILTNEGPVDAVVIDVGGFLGMGEKPVAVGFDKLAFMQDKDGNKYLYTTLTKERLEAQVAYDKNTYVEQRDQQRLMVQ